MKLLTILISFIIIRYTTWGGKLQRYNWFKHYSDWIRSYLNRFENKPELYLLIFISIPFLICTLLLEVAVRYSFLYFMLNVFILVYCWAFVRLTNISNADFHEKNHKIFWYVLQPFSLIFWYILAGPIGALLYCMISLSKTGKGAVIAVQWEQILDWPASRLLGFGYALAGHFNPCFSYWRSYLFSSPSLNKIFLEKCGNYALFGDQRISNHLLTEKENYHAQSLVSRAQIMLFVVLFVFTLGKWLY